MRCYPANSAKPDTLSKASGHATELWLVASSAYSTPSAISKSKITFNN